MPSRPQLRIQASVGHDAVNDPADVRAVQAALAVVLGDAGPRPDGICGASTIEALRGYQAAFARAPDGRCEPGSRTLRRLRAALEEAPPRPRDARWAGDPATWPEAEKLASLNPTFRAALAGLLAELRAASHTPEIACGWRAMADGARFGFENAQLPDGTPDAWAADVVDIAAAQGGERSLATFWGALGDAARSRGLVWGGDRAASPDPARVQGLPHDAIRRVKRESGLG